MTVHWPPPGAAPVGALEALPAADVAAIRFLRLWSAGAEGQRAVYVTFCDRLGEEAGQAALGCFERLLSLCIGHGRRPLSRHGLECRCAGGDECWFARLIAAAAQGEREDAMMLAMLMVRADLAPHLAGLAEQVGLCLRRMGPGGPAPRPATVSAAAQTLH
ncbi:MAG: hypothetical protein ACK5IB_00550 [Qingshengfaniella sp.]